MNNNNHILIYNQSSNKFVSSSQHVLKARLKEIDLGWVTILNSSVIVTGCVVDYAIRKYTDIDNFVHMRGLISIVPEIEDQILFNLGATFPDQKNFVIPFQGQGLRYGLTLIKIEANGDVKIVNQNHTEEFQINMESIPPIRAV